MFRNRVKQQACALIVFLAFYTATTAAVVKNQKDDVKARKAYTQPIPAQRVLKDFTSSYTSPPDSKILKIVPGGKIRNFTQTRGDGRVQARAHEVALITRLGGCGIQIRDIWEVLYYKLETEWIFLDIRKIKSAQITKSNKKPPVPGDPEMKNLISNAIMKEYPGHDVAEITLLTKKGYWDLCMPMHRVMSKIKINARDDISNRLSVYECEFTSTLALKNTAWEHVKSSCVYKGKEAARCHVGTFCLAISSESTIPRVPDEEALSLVRASFEKEYSLRKNNIAVENFYFIRRLPHEDFGTKIPCIIHAGFVLDEKRDELTDEEGTKKRSYITTRAAYECVVYGYLKYSLLEKKWEGFIEYCCPSENERCGLPCSLPNKGCKRLGEK